MAMRLSVLSARVLPAAAVLFFAAAAAARADYVTSVTLPVPLMPQQTNVWCWAAGGQMVMQYYGFSVAQCAQANAQFGQSNCCTTPFPTPCVHGGKVLIANYGFSYQELGAGASLTQAQIKQQIMQRQSPWIINPHCVDSSVCDGWGHVIVGTGLLAYANYFWMNINDPWPPNTGDTYLEYYTTYTQGCWLLGSCSGRGPGYDLYDIVAPKIPTPAPATYPQSSVVVQPPTLQRLELGDADPRVVAAAAWDFMHQTLPKRSMAAVLGITAESSAAVQVGDPIRRSEIRIAALRAWDGISRIDSLVTPVDGTFVPLLAAGVPRALVHLRRADRVWKVTAVGSPRLSRALVAAQITPQDFVLELPETEIVFVARQTRGGLTLRPLFSDPRLEVRALRAEPAERVLARVRLAPVSTVGPARR